MKKFKKINGEVIEDLNGYIRDYIKSKNDEGSTVEIHIGCDSQRHGPRYVFATALCLRLIRATGTGGGVHMLSHTESFPVSKVTEQQKFMNETEFAVQVALDLRDAGFKDSMISVHIDFNPDSRFVSNKYLSQGRGWIEGVGFKCERKPYAWAASYAGDRHAKFKA